MIADLGEQNALKLGYIAQLEFSDEEARYNLDIPEEVEIQDADRLSWARLEQPPFRPDIVLFDNA